MGLGSNGMKEWMLQWPVEIVFFENMQNTPRQEHAQPAGDWLNYVNKSALKDEVRKQAKGEGLLPGITTVEEKDLLRCD